MILILNGLPAVWAAMLPPAAASTLNFVTRLVNVAVTNCGLPPMLKLHVFPTQPVMPAVWPLQPINVESLAALAVSVPTSLLPI